MSEIAMQPPSDTISLDQAVRFIWAEADMLDQHQYQDWLALWTPDGKYVIPGAAEGDDFENSLNYAYDDDAMRKLRVARLIGGMSISAASAARKRVLTCRSCSIVVWGLNRIPRKVCRSVTSAPKPACALPIRCGKG